MYTITTTPTPTRQRLQARGEIELGAHGLVHLYQSGDARIRFPRCRAPAVEAVLMNTAGGLTGGDRLDWCGRAIAGAVLCLTTAAAEKVYRSHGPVARVTSRLTVESGAMLAWLPQETIVFNGAALERRLDVTLQAGASLLACESIILGRKQMGERLRRIHLIDQWRIYRDQRLLHAESLRLVHEQGTGALEARALQDGGAFATLLYCKDAPHESLQSIADRCMNVPSTDSARLAASVLEGRVVIRLLAQDAQRLRQVLLPCLRRIDGVIGVPRVWQL